MIVDLKVAAGGTYNDSNSFLARASIPFTYVGFNTYSDGRERYVVDPDNQFIVKAYESIVINVPGVGPVPVYALYNPHNPTDDLPSDARGAIFTGGAQGSAFWIDETFASANGPTGNRIIDRITASDSVTLNQHYYPGAAVWTMEAVGGIPFSGFSNAILDAGFGNLATLYAYYNNQNWRFTGAAGSDKFTGGNLSDTINGGGGNDTLDGGGGFDTFLFTGDATSLGLDQVDGGAGSGDTIEFTGLTSFVWIDLAYAGATGTEAWSRNGSNWIQLANISRVENVTGTAFADEIWGDSVANTINGGARSDKITGRGGADILYGGTGTDTFFFTGAATTLGLDQVDGGGEDDTIDFTGLTTFAWVDLAYNGTEVWSQVGANWVQLANVTQVENAIGTAFADQLTGDGLANTFTGAAGNDIFNGRGGNDTLNGDAGNDSFLFTGVGSTLGVDQVNGGANTDTLDFTGLTTFAFVDFAYTGATGIEAWTQTGATWVALANVTQVENAIGTAFADQLTGDGQANTFNGAAGADIFNGRAGADVFTGGAASDTFKFAAGDSGQTTTTLDTITDYAKGAVGTGDKFDFTAVLAIGGSNAAATATQASISTTTGVASFMAGQGTTMADALSDIAARMTAAADAAGEFAFFRVNNTGNMHLFISDGVAGVGTNDVVVQLNTITTIGSINITAGDVTILT